MGGIVFVVLMFAVPAAIAMNGMFGSGWGKIVRGETEDRVRYVRHDEPAKAEAKPAAKPKKKDEATSEGGAA